MQEEIFLAPLVTLVDPPPSAPPDNRDLCEANWRRLRAAVQTWEQETGQTLQPAIGLGG
jgi:hypothetical protein